MLLLSLLGALIKLPILSALYWGILWTLLWKVSPTAWRPKLQRTPLHLFGGLAVAIVLIGWANTHWGNHGWGDVARLPLPEGKAIRTLNGNITSLDQGHHEVWVNSFAIYPDAGYVVGLTSDNPVDSFLPYFVWDLKTGVIAFQQNSEGIAAKLPDQNLPPQSDLDTFWNHYLAYWGGLRAYLLF